MKNMYNLYKNIQILAHICVYIVKICWQKKALFKIPHDINKIILQQSEAKKFILKLLLGRTHD